MKIAEFYEGVRPAHAMVLVVSFFSLFSPGILILGLYNSDYLKDLDVAKLMLLSSALSIPFHIPALFSASLIATIMELKERPGEKPEIPLPLLWTMTAIIAFSKAYSAIAWAYLANLSVRSFVVTCIGMEAGFMLVCLWVWFRGGITHKREL